MFENMIKHKKVWDLFSKWLWDNYEITLEYSNYHGVRFWLKENMLFPEDFILSILPFFFDEYGIIIEILHDSEENNYWFNIYRNQFSIFDTMDFPVNSQIEALQKVCEKASEILGKQLNEK